VGERKHVSLTGESLKKRESTHVDGHLDARLCAGALEDDVKAVGLLEDRERGVGVGLGARERLVRVRGWGQVRREAVRGVGVALGRGEREAPRVDVDRAYPARAERASERGSEQPNRPHAEHEHALPACERGAPRGVQEYRQRLGHGCLVECARVGEAVGDA
jgi:hypothetical protein